MIKLIVLAGILASTLSGCAPSVADRLTANIWGCGNYGTLVFTKANTLTFTSKAVSPPKHYESPFEMTTDVEGLGRRWMARLVLANPEVAGAMFGGATAHKSLLIGRITPGALSLSSGDSAVEMTCYAE